MVVLAFVLGTSISCRWARDHEVLRDIYTPTFTTAPEPAPLDQAIAELRADLDSERGRTFLERVLPDQAGTLWLALLVALVVAFNVNRLASPRNVDLALFLALGAAFFNIMSLSRPPITPAYLTLLDVIFTVVVVLELVLIARALMRAIRGRDEPWRPNLTRGALVMLALTLVTLNLLAALVRTPDDAGWFVNLGAQRLREHGHLPYGDPLLTNTAGAAYGPVLYAAHVPFQMLVSPGAVNETSPERPPLGEASTYRLPPLLATQLATIAFHLIAVISLFRIAARMSGDSLYGWAAVALYCGSAFVLGMGGEREFIGGMTFVSHVAPPAALLLAFGSLARPSFAGGLLAVAAGIGFFPAFLFPVWAAYYWPDRKRLSRFTAGFFVTAALIGGATYALSREAEGLSRVGTIMRDTLGHHTDPAGYGRSGFGFWGQRPGLRGWMMQPTVGESGMTSPTYLLFFGLIAGCAWVARGSRSAALALTTGAVALGASLVKVHSTGTYVEWAYPFLLLGIFADRAIATTAARAAAGFPLAANAVK